LIEGSCFAAQPGGTVARVAFEEMRDEILAQLKAALPVDGVVLSLHGAMVAQGYDDCEGDILARVRSLVGPKTVIGVEYDPHCHATVARTRLSDIDVYYKEYPHTDFEARGEEVVTLVLATIRGQIRPMKSLYDCRLIASFPTTIEPMRSFVDRISGMEGRDKVLSISIGHGFYGDVPTGPAFSSSPTVPGAWRCARGTARAGADRDRCPLGAGFPRAGRGDRCGIAGARPGAGGHRRYPRQCRRRRAFRQHDIYPQVDGAQGGGGGRGTDLGPDGGARLLRRRRRRAHSVALRRQDGGDFRCTGRCPGQCWPASSGMPTFASAGAARQVAAVRTVGGGVSAILISVRAQAMGTAYSRA
jgi:hypothetical protein